MKLYEHISISIDRIQDIGMDNLEGTESRRLLWDVLTDLLTAACALMPVPASMLNAPEVSGPDPGPELRFWLLPDDAVAVGTVAFPDGQQDIRPVLDSGIDLGPLDVTLSDCVESPVDEGEE